MKLFPCIAALLFHELICFNTSSLQFHLPLSIPFLLPHPPPFSSNSISSQFSLRKDQNYQENPPNGAYEDIIILGTGNPVGGKQSQEQEHVSHIQPHSHFQRSHKNTKVVAIICIERTYHRPVQAPYFFSTFSVFPFETYFIEICGSCSPGILYPSDCYISPSPSSMEFPEFHRAESNGNVQFRLSLHLMAGLGSLHLLSSAASGSILDEVLDRYQPISICGY